MQRITISDNEYIELRDDGGIDIYSKDVCSMSYMSFPFFIHCIQNNVQLPHPETLSEWEERMEKEGRITKYPDNPEYNIELSKEMKQSVNDLEFSQQLLKSTVNTERQVMNDLLTYGSAGVKTDKDGNKSNMSIDEVFDMKLWEDHNGNTVKMKHHPKWDL